ncbi:MAG: diguanylate cyclase [Candidatus Omnitrophica bacterium]|nr:diguanylate cyclase [Candidatus Omnitrophota bacterium]
MDSALRVLIVEDSQEDAFLLVRELKKGGYDVLFECVDTAIALNKNLEEHTWDIVISDYSMPQFNGLEALELLKKKSMDIPFILVSGKVGEETAVEAMKAGAHDYIMKNDLTRLVPAIRRELKDAEARKKQRESEKDRVRRYYQLEVLSRTSQHINVVLEVPIIMQTLVAAAIELVGATGGTAGLLENGKMKFSEYNEGGKLKKLDFSFGPGKGVPGWVDNDTIRPYMANDAAHDTEVIPEIKKAFNAYNLVSIPIFNKTRQLTGCFLIYNKENRAPFEPEDIFTLQGLAASAAVALENARMMEEIKTAKDKTETLYNELLRSSKKLKKLSLVDPQTGLFNHRYLNEVMESELQRAKKEGGCFSVSMIDIDYFKSVNDVYGHHVGDLVITQFAKHLKSMIRRYDVVTRSGGEEFVVLFPDTDRVKAIALSQRLLEALNKCEFGNKERVIKLRTSIAVASYPDDNIIKSADLMNLAETILEKIKGEGGNKVCSCLDIKDNKLCVKWETGDIPEVRFLKEKIEKLGKREKQNSIEAIFAFAKTIESRDHYTGEHVEETIRYSMKLAKELRLSKEETEKIRQASILHDLGKVGISDKILHKKTKLTVKEFEEIKKHPQIAADIRRTIHFMKDITPLVLYHHERWDGKGYPEGLKGTDIPVGARIIALADVYQALTSNRPYRKAYPPEKALEIIEQNSGKQFDPAITETFLGILKNKV